MPLNVVFRQGTRAITSSLTSHRLFLYGFVSTLAVCAAVANALRNYNNFYSVAIYLSRSSRSVLVLANFAIILALLAGHLVQKIFFGTLRANEVERLYDRLWIFVTESLLAFTIFRDEFDAPFAIMFGSLLFIKSFHWLAADRIEWMDQQPYPGPSLLFHFRMSILFLILCTADLLMLLFAVENTLNYGVGGMVLFACEYGILLATVANTIAKYLLSVYDLRRATTRGGENAPPWEQKSIWTFYFELITDFSKLTTYLCFFTIILTFYGLPLNIVRDIYFTARSFVTRLKALRRYQTATRNMDERYPNATSEEMAASDHTCIICREEMILPAEGAAQPTAAEGPNTTPKKLPCGHIFHFHCLRSWLERQQSCPTCRRTVLETTPPNRPTEQRQTDPPAPGAAPQPNAPALNRNPAPPNANNNGLELLRRLVTNTPREQHRANVAGGNNQPVNVIIQYDVHNYGANAQQGPAPVTERRPPQFTGFHGPGGVWQPWQADGAHPAQGPVPTNLVIPTPTQPAPTPAQLAPPPTADVISQPNTSSDPSVQPEGTASASTSNPREAAALAALRRLNSQSSASSSSSPVHETAGSTTPVAEDCAPANGASPTTSTVPVAQPWTFPRESAEPSAASSTELPASATDTNGPATFTSPPGGIHLPSLIPLDINPRRTSTFSVPTMPRTLRQRMMTPLAQLPPTLTPEQLSLMDRVTREAIDERLRVLEGVSGAVYRCIDELMRVRSTLPPSGSMGPPAPPPAQDSNETPVEQA